MSTETAIAYWRKQKLYPFPFTKLRRIHELNYLVPRIHERRPKSLLDLGCGDGSLLEILLRLTDIQDFHGCDIAADLLAEIDPRVQTSVYDLNKPGPLPTTECVIVGGVIQYLFDDAAVDRVLSLIPAGVVWIRSTCTLKADNERVDKDGYASCYRTLPNTHALIAQHFDVSAVDRVYPDDIESPFGTKQFYFEAHRRA